MMRLTYLKPIQLGAIFMLSCGATEAGAVGIVESTYYEYTYFMRQSYIGVESDFHGNQLVSEIRSDREFAAYRFGFYHFGWDVLDLSGHTLSFDRLGYSPLLGIEELWAEDLTGGDKIYTDSTRYAAVTFGRDNNIVQWDIFSVVDTPALSVHIRSTPESFNLAHLEPFVDPEMAIEILAGVSFYDVLYSEPSYFLYGTQKGRWEMTCTHTYHFGGGSAGECAAISAVPLPASGLLLAGGMICLFATSRRRSGESSVGGGALTPFGLKLFLRRRKR